MHKRELHHIWTRIKPISYWYFVLGFVVFGTVAVFALRNNNITAINLRTQLYQVDKENGDVADSLNTLRVYIYSHMNTNLSSGSNAIYPPIQLKYTYQRLVDAQKASVDQANTQVYTDAENYCQALIPNGFSGRGRVPCIENYVSTHGTKAQTIPPALYEYDFVSPFWSPDLAGWSIIISIVFLVLAITRFILERWLKNRLEISS
jgi:hypothetical protein